MTKTDLLLLTAVLGLTAQTSRAANETPPAEACASAFSSAASPAVHRNRAAHQYVKLIEFGVQRKLLSHLDVEQTLRSLEQGSLPNPYAQLSLGGAHAGVKKGVKNLVQSGRLRAQDVLPPLRDLSTRLKNQHEQNETVSHETRLVFTAALDEKVERRGFRKLVHPDGSMWLSEPFGTERSARTVLLSVNGVASQQQTVMAPQPDGVLLGFDKNGHRIWVTGLMDSQPKLEIVNETTKARVELPRRRAERKDRHYDWISDQNGQPYFLIKDSEKTGGGRLLAVDINNPAMQYVTELKHAAAFARLFHATQLSTGETAFYFQILVTDNSHVYMKWVLGKEPEILPVPASDKKFYRSRNSPHAMRINTQEDIPILQRWNLETGETYPDVALKDLDRSAHSVYTDDQNKSQLAILRDGDGPGTVEITMIDLDDTSHREKIFLKDVPRSNLATFKIFQLLNGQRLLVMEMNIGIVVRLLEPISAMSVLIPTLGFVKYGYVRSRGEERLWIKDGNGTAMHFIYSTPPQTEVKP